MPKRENPDLRVIDPANTIGHATGRRRETLQQILLIAGSLAFGLALIEAPALIGIVDYGRLIGLDSSWLPRNRVADPELRHTGRPNAHFTGSALGGNVALEVRIPRPMLTPYRWDVTYDSRGFRNPRAIEKADLAVIGDSYVEGMTVPEPRLMTSLLSRLAGATVVNLGQSGYGPQQELIVLRRYALPLHPRIVIWMFYEGNDLSDVEEYESAMHRPQSFLAEFARRSFSRNVLRRVSQLVRPDGAKVSAAVPGASPDKPRICYFGRQSKFSATPLSAASVRDLNVAATSVREGQEICASAGCRLLVAYIPTAFRAMRDFCQFPAASECARWIPNDLPDRFRQAIQNASPATAILDLTPALAEAVSKGSLPYYPDDAHWTEEGHRVAATAIAQYLRSLDTEDAPTAPRPGATP